MSTLAPVTDSDVRPLVADWYAKLDAHVPVAEYAPLLAPDVEFRFPEGTVRGFEGFRGWYDTVTRKFFDETHMLKTVDVTPNGDAVDVKVVVNWQASMWK